ncbi:hypothetical protein AYO20_08144 [Fonsecaea nubica]|uniref:Uncharacterized protein n=1 Tax=Fonsecaea nubica TaxID=856822 RepID=A0A178CRS8_9EURO|nr:hypothetical protein AYO20_08144 [Fonsecaea nubica]OAL31601.1 hypothetical protein AYO20_08144 [Fonsecaea nubica]
MPHHLDQPSTPAEVHGQQTVHSEEEQEHREQQPQTKDNTAWMAVGALSWSPLLSLPYELRQRIFQYAFMTSSENFPPQARSPSRAPNAVGDGYNVSGPGSSTRGGNNKIVQSLLVCRQLYQETRLIPFQVNCVKCPAVMGSNTLATKRLIDALQPFQRRAIRRLELHLLASVTEAWSLRSILRSIAGVTETETNCTLRQSGGGTGDEISFDGNAETDKRPEKDSDTSLRELSVHMTTRDLLLAQADSMVGLLHMLMVAPFSQERPSTAFAWTAAWVTEGLAFLESLRKLTIVVESSLLVAKQLAANERWQFEQTLKSSLPTVEVKVEWRLHRDINLEKDDGDWVNFLWVHDSNIGAPEHGATEPDLGRKDGVSSWTYTVP